ncbi:MAG: polysaccharide deacetylase family protein, partial [Deltaproteobacteria bacterium]|nr:polysaccharide deacetylase family protein [Deltaproteobacteria bacterium]
RWRGPCSPSSWGRCESRVLFNMEKILTLFGRFKVKATFFVLGYVAERRPEVVRMIEGEGHEIASHGYGHVQVFKQTKDEFLQDLLRSKSLLESMTGDKVIGYRAPQWSICKGERDSYWALDLLAENGFLYDSSIAPLRFIGIPDAPAIPYTLSTPHGDIKEVPPLVMRSPLGNLPIGGGWGLRIFSYRSIHKRILRHNREGHPGVIFCHPSDFDSHTPSIPLPWIKRFVCYGKIKTTEERMIRLLNDFEFISIKEFIYSKENKIPIQNDPLTLPLSPMGRGRG